MRTLFLALLFISPVLLQAGGTKKSNPSLQKPQKDKKLKEKEQEWLDYLKIREKENSRSADKWKTAQENFAKRRNLK